MGTLTPGVEYIYERDGNMIYAREKGSLVKKLVGYECNFDNVSVDVLWRNIHREALTNPALQKALDQCIILYHLSTSTEPYVVMHHSV